MRRIGEVQAFDPVFHAAADSTGPAEIVAEGFEWSEGPLWLAGPRCLLFSDIPRNTVFRWHETEGLSRYLQPSGYTGSKARGGESGSNALTLDPAGNLVLCQHGDRRMSRMDAPLSDPAPRFVPLATHYGGKRFNSPNDTVYHKNELFFTDPPYGLEGNMDDPAKELDFQGVFKVDKTGDVHVLTKSLSRPNGIAFFPGSDRFIVSNSDPDTAKWQTFELRGKDCVDLGIFYDATSFVAPDTGLPDGLKISSAGIVFATGPGGVWVFDSNGRLLEKILIPCKVSNIALVERDTTMFVTAHTFLLRVRLRDSLFSGKDI